MKFHFWYFAEVFIFLMLAGVLHPTIQIFSHSFSTWWLVIYFTFIDYGEWKVWQKSEILLGNIKETNTKA